MAKDYFTVLIYHPSFVGRHFRRLYFLAVVNILCGHNFFFPFCSLSLFLVYIPRSRISGLCGVYFQLRLTLLDPMDCSPPGSLSMGFLKQEYWSGLPFPTPRNLPDPGIKPASLALAGRFFTTVPPGSWVVWYLRTYLNSIA